MESELEPENHRNIAKYGREVLEKAAMDVAMGRTSATSAGDKGAMDFTSLGCGGEIKTASKPELDVW